MPLSVCPSGRDRAFADPEDAETHSSDREGDTMKTFIRTGIILILLGLILSLPAACRHLPVRRAAAEDIRTSEDFRPRTIVTTDGECDDLNSFIHLLLCANDMDIRGIVLTSSCYHYSGDPEKGIESYRWAGEDWMETYISAYEEIYPNLASHDPRYPSADDLRAVTAVGNIRGPGDVGETTDGSRLIREEILRDDSSILFLQCWGGSNSVARALMDIEAEGKNAPDWEDRKERISSKLVIYLISTQDDTYQNYIADTWPHVTVLHNTKSFEALAFNWKAVLDSSQTQTLRAQWQLAGILHQDNPLLKLYYTYWDDRPYVGELPQYQYSLKQFNLPRFWRFLTYHGGWFRYGDFLSEGDSPAFLFLLDSRLKDREEFEIDNWGGRFVKVRDNYYVDNYNAADGIGRYVTAINEDFARRVRWSETASY